MTSDYNRLLRYSVPLMLLLFAFVIKALSLGYSDFASYYFGSQELLTGFYKNAYDTATLNLIAYKKGFHGLFISYTPFPPFTALVFSPLTLLPITSAKIIFNVCSCLVFLWSLIRAFRYFSIDPLYLLLVPVVFFTPLRSTIFFGQTYLLLFALLIEGYMAYDKEEVLWCALCWALAILFKVFPVLLVFFLLIRKKYKQLFYLTAVGLFLFALSITISGWAAWQLYIFDIVPRVNNGELNDSFTWIFQSGFMLLKNAFIYDALSNPFPFYSNAYLFAIGWALFKSFFIAACIVVTQHKYDKELLSFSLWITASLLISPNGSTYSLVLVLLPFIALVKLSIPVNLKIAIFILLVLVCNFPNHYMASFPLLLKFPRLYFMIAFFIGMMVVSSIPLRAKWIAVCFIGFLLLESPRLWKTSSDSSTYVLKTNAHLLIYDYRLKPHQLVYSYWSEKGGEQVSLKDNLSTVSSNAVSLIDNQIFYKGKQLTHSADWKRKPMLHGNDIYYLSDKNKGVGFYTLRKIEIH